MALLDGTRIALSDLFRFWLNGLGGVVSLGAGVIVGIILTLGWPEDGQVIVHKGARFYDARVGLVCPQNTGHEAMKEVAGDCGWIKFGRVRVTQGREVGWL